MTVWKDISTAPKDGARVLVCDTGVDRWVCIARFIVVDEDGVWVDDDNSVIDEQPDYWMPLPPPPDNTDV